jgi:mono/diheme cytochrome c family protein
VKSENGNISSVARSFRLLLFCLSISSIGAAEPQPALQIGSKTWPASELLSRPDLENITITNDPAYNGRAMHYRAVKAANLFEATRFRDDDVIQFHCADGFVAPISKERIIGIGPNRSKAYVAIEDPKAKWPELPSKEHSGTAGPFYLVWMNPEMSGILQEEWPFKIVSFDVKGAIRDLYPAIFPKNQNDPGVERGLKLFQMTCFACHTMNKQGVSQIGPDLNLPMNPTEYFKDSSLPRYIRDPKSVRWWDGNKMPSFDPKTFSDQDIADVIAYLRVMAAEKSNSFH